MVEVIENEFLIVEIFREGAELKSIYHKQKKQELLWQGSSLWWPRRAPVLFPIVGKLNNNTYKVEGAQFSLPQHGFARDRNFETGEKQAARVEFILRSDEELLKIYPFDFTLKISYQLEGTSLTVNYEIENPGQKPLLFSIGAHPGFVCPMNDNEALSDYYLEFEKEETLERQLLDGGLFNGETEPVLVNQNVLALNDDLFLKDAIVFKNMRSAFLTLKSSKSDYSLKFSFEGFPYFGIWQKPGAPFICLEPWCGLADRKGFDGELKDKEGIISLDAGNTFSRSYTLTV